MFSPSTLTAIGRTLTFFYKSGCLPFRWNGRQGEIEFQQSRGSRIWARGFLGFAVFYCLFLYSQIYRLLGQSELVVMDFYWVSIYSGGYSVSVDALLTSARKPEEWVSFFQRIRDFSSRIKETARFQDSAKFWRKAETLLHLIVLGNILVGISVFACNVLIYTFSARIPHFPYSIYREYDSSLLGYLAFQLMELYNKGVLMLWFFAVNTWFICGVAVELISISVLRKSHSLPVSERVRLFRQVYILNRLHNNCYLPTGMPMRLWMFGYLTVEGVAVLVRLSDHIHHLFEYGFIHQVNAAMVVAAFLFLHISGSVLQKSGHLILELRREAAVKGRSGAEEMKHRRKVGTALSPFGVRCEPNRTTSFGGMMQYFLAIINGTMTVLVSIPTKGG